MFSLPPRSPRLELLDGDHIPEKDLVLNMQELNTINHLLGGHAITCQGFLQVTQQARKQGRTHFRVLEIGCGGGDNLLALYRLGQKLGLQLEFIGVDWKEACLDVARQRTELQPYASWWTIDYKEAAMNQPADVVFSSLFCHHFSDEELPHQLRWMADNATLGFFINDLERNRFAQWAIQVLTRLFSKSYLVKHDAPLSVMRGFTLKEWKALLHQAKLPHAQAHWQWAFRHLITFQHPAHENAGV